MNSILLTEDHSIVRKGLRTIIVDMLGFTILDEADSLSTMMVALREKTYTHAIFDMILPDGQVIEKLSDIRKFYPELNVAVLSQQAPNVYLPLLEKYGVKKYIVKSAKEDVVVAGLSDFLNDREVKIYDGKLKETPFDGLSQRELEVLHYLLKGEKPSDIARILDISNQSVSTYTERIHDKTKTENKKMLWDLAQVYGIN